MDLFNLNKLSDMDLHDQLAHYGYEFVDTSADAQRLEKAPLMILSTKGANTPLIRIFSFEFRWENPKSIDAPAEMRKNHIDQPESLWVDLNFNIRKNMFEVTPSAVKVTPRGIPVPAYRARALFKRSIPIVLQVSDEVIETQEAYDSLENYRQKQFDIGIIGPLMVERVRRFLHDFEFHVKVDDLRGRESNDHLRHTLTDEQKDFVIDRINSFIAGVTAIKEQDEAPIGETNEDFPPRVDPKTTDVLVDRDQVSH